MTGANVKYFTPEEANRTLPLVKRIIKDILSYSSKLRKIYSSLNSEVEENRETRYLLSSIKGFISELDEIGCIYKGWDYSMVLIDFPAIIDNREVYLCWKSDEEKVTHYHEIDEGFRKRKLIPKYYFKPTENK